MSRPGTAASLLKVIFNGNLSLSDDRILKLAPGKNQDTETAPRWPKLKNGHKNAIEPEEVKIQVVNQEELEALKEKVYLLETQIKEEKEKSDDYFRLSWASRLLNRCSHPGQYSRI